MLLLSLWFFLDSYDSSVLCTGTDTVKFVSCVFEVTGMAEMSHAVRVKDVGKVLIQMCLFTNCRSGALMMTNTKATILDTCFTQCSGWRMGLVMVL